MIGVLHLKEMSFQIEQFFQFLHQLNLYFKKQNRQINNNFSLKISLDKTQEIDENVQEVQDDTKVKNLQNQKQELEKKISDDEEFIQQQRQKLEELQQEYEITITEKISYASNEVETWIKKYSNLEKNYNDSQQKIQNLKKQLAQVEAADKAIQDQKRMETKQEVRKSSKMY
ncbi:unnamed protein product [Paramecium pentaurelia]|uniref:Uncharacterized protein n=1 Tax=Paramecium pentaurelia TaxID=43138 RepID=A0A8S1X0L4_9CILI|nr:unnamed protein product [Paramecium pentaurelia]